MNKLTNLDDTCQRISTPKDVNIELMEHQKTAIFSMWSLEKNPKIIVDNINYYQDRNLTLELNINIGILSDKTGSGKTLMILGLIKHCLISPKTDIHFMGTKYLYIKNITKNINTKCNLILIPSHLRIQWEKEIMYLSNTNYYIIGSSKQLDGLEEAKLDNYELILLSDSMIGKF